MDALLARGAVVHEQAADGRAPLHVACAEGHAAAALALLHAGASAGLTSADGSSALHEAAAAGLSSLLHPLLTAGAALDGVAGDGKRSALVAACFRGREAAALALLEAGADAALADRKGWTLHGKQSQTGLISALIAQGGGGGGSAVKLDAHSSTGVTPLLLACQQATWGSGSTGAPGFRGQCRGA